MSTPSHNDDEGDAASPAHEQTYEGVEQHAAAHSSAHLSPVMRLHRHALESIFGMLELTDLVQILSISRAWSASVLAFVQEGNRVEPFPRSASFDASWRLVQPAQESAHHLD